MEGDCLINSTNLILVGKGLHTVVRTPSRLHLGVIDLNGELGRIYGGLGVAIECPNVVLDVFPSQELMVQGERKNFVEQLTKNFLRHFRIDSGACIRVKEVIPEHVGLGSTTQLSLAVASGLARSFGLNVSISELAKITGGGKRSGIGVAAFERGGFIVEGGHKLEENKLTIASGEIPPVIARLPFPEEWLFVVAIPNVSRGLSEEKERSAFQRLSPVSSEQVGKICRLVLMNILPSLKEMDIVNFGRALTEVQRIVGEYFKTIQGGVFGSQTGEKCVEFILKNGAYGGGQSSWGPAIYGLVEGGNEAESLKWKVKRFLQERGGGHVFCARANNSGAHIQTVEFGR